MPEDDALVILLRYPQELVSPDEYKLPQGRIRLPGGSQRTGDGQAAH